MPNPVEVEQLCEEGGALRRRRCRSGKPDRLHSILKVKKVSPGIQKAVKGLPSSEISTGATAAME
jgi:hypothetical protein